MVALKTLFFKCCFATHGLATQNKSELPLAKYIFHLFILSAFMASVAQHMDIYLQRLIWKFESIVLFSLVSIYLVSSISPLEVKILMDSRINNPNLILYIFIYNFLLIFLQLALSVFSTFQSVYTWTLDS